MNGVFVGISGWSYQEWRGTFYPEGLPRKKELEYASRKLSSLEINATFYNLFRPKSYKSWYRVTPSDFIFSVKANRFISHIKRLKEIKLPLANFFASGPLCLKEKLGPFLWQFPPGMRFDPDQFEMFLTLLPKDFKQAIRLGKENQLEKERVYLEVEMNLPLRHAVEIRHESFLNPWFIQMMKEHQVAIVFAETDGRWPYMEDITSDFIYIRLHGDKELYVSDHNSEILRFWAERIKLWNQGQEPSNRLTLIEDFAPIKRRDIYVYFDNDAKVRAPADAKKLIDLLK